MLGVVIALPSEAVCLLGRDTPVGGPRQYRDILVSISGMGPERASQAAENLVRSGARALLSWGTAAALDPALRSGQLLLPEHILQVDGSRLSVDPRWRKALLERLGSMLRPRGGTLISSNRAITTPSAKQTLFQSSGAVAVDMESAAVASIANTAGLPFACIRAIVDEAGMSIPELALTTVDAYGRPRLPLLLQGLLHRPATLPALIRLGRSFSRARTSLRTVSRCCGYNLALPAAPH